MEEYFTNSNSDFSITSSTTSDSLFHMVDTSKRNHGEWFSVKAKNTDGKYTLNIRQSLKVPYFYRFYHIKDCCLT